jgi:hypothetical protein
MKKESKRSRLPGIAFATIVTTGVTIAICLGESRWYKVDTVKGADELNRLFGVTPSQSRAALAAMLRGWNPSGTVPALEDSPDTPVHTAEPRDKPGNSA